VRHREAQVGDAGFEVVHEAGNAALLLPADRTSKFALVVPYETASSSAICQRTVQVRLRGGKPICSICSAERTGLSID
jgi:hypothetical protein